MKQLQNSLTIKQRILAVLIYVNIFLFGTYYFNNSWNFLFNSDSSYNLLFISGALLLIFGTYIAEPFFTKPIDVITNSTAVVLALMSVNDPSTFFGYWQLFYASAILGTSAIIMIFLSQFQIVERIQKVFFRLITILGKSKFIFSIIYILTIISYFGDKPLEFSFFFTFWVIFSTQFIVERSVTEITKAYLYLKIKKDTHEIIGEAIGCENPFLYKVEVDFLKHKNTNTKKGELVYLLLNDSLGAVGIIINEKQLLNKKWISVYLLEKDNIPLKIDLKKQTFISGSKNIFSKDNSVCKLDIEQIEDDVSKQLILENDLYKYRDNFIGYIADGSNVSKILFHSLVDITNKKHELVREGAVIKSKIHGQEALFQIIDGKTNEEQLEKHDVYGYVIGIAKKLGKYNQSKHELETLEWLPNIYSPVFIGEMKSETKNPLSIGKLPTTNFEIVIKDPNSLVTHNTAILGILGIGKSCLTFELIQKTLVETKVKVICIDITNEYIEELPKYIKDIEALDSESVNTQLSQNYESINKDVKKGGNHLDFSYIIKEKLTVFLNSKNNVLCINPEEFNVSRQTKEVKPKKIGPGQNDWEDQAPMEDLSIAEKTRLISEEVLNLSKEKGKTNHARILLVFEEAHSLIPEWNSVSNSGDQNASNGTAKVILQGRKYGLGSFVVTQRTANISKSILNQCNTIFALRIFDDTGKEFLENYIGSDYSNTLPTLEERHAIVIGKALRLKQPVIVRLNNKKDIILKDDSDTPL